MLASQRYQYILEQLQQFDHVTVEQLMQDLNASSATIRRDLTVLEEKQLLKRVHGGAKRYEQMLSIEKSIEEKLQQFLKEKQSVARFAVNKFVHENSTIFLDAGSSTHAIIPLLKGLNVSVVTNGAHHINQLMQYGVPTTLIGGRLRQTTGAIVGSLAIHQLSQMVFDLAIIGTNGIDLSFGLTTPDSEEAILKQTIIQQSKKTIVLATNEKFDVMTLNRFATINQVTIVTDDCPEKYVTIESIYRSKI